MSTKTVRNPDFAQTALRVVEEAIGGTLYLKDLDGELLERSRMMLERSRTNRLSAAALLEDAGIMSETVHFLRFLAELDAKKLSIISAYKAEKEERKLA